VKKIVAIIGGLVAGVVAFTVAAGIVAAVATALANTSWSPASTVTIAIGLLLEVLKWGIAIWCGYRVYKYLSRKLRSADADVV
jgi:hypothetical protein